MVFGSGAEDCAAELATNATDIHANMTERMIGRTAIAIEINEGLR